jgi:hypothetical protein
MWMILFVKAVVGDSFFVIRERCLGDENGKIKSGLYS